VPRKWALFKLLRKNGLFLLPCVRGPVTSTAIALYSFCSSEQQRCFRILRPGKFESKRPRMVSLAWNQTIELKLCFIHGYFLVRLCYVSAFQNLIAMRSGIKCLKRNRKNSRQQPLPGSPGKTGRAKAGVNIPLNQ
jgi:hypothetical protein